MLSSTTQTVWSSVADNLKPLSIPTGTTQEKSNSHRPDQSTHQNVRTNHHYIITKKKRRKKQQIKSTHQPINNCLAPPAKARRPASDNTLKRRTVTTPPVGQPTPLPLPGKNLYQCLRLDGLKNTQAMPFAKILKTETIFQTPSTHNYNRRLDETKQKGRKQSNLAKQLTGIE